MPNSFRHLFLILCLLAVPVGGAAQSLPGASDGEGAAATALAQRRAAERSLSSALSEAIGLLPSTARAEMSFTAEDAEAIQRHNDQASPGAPLQVGIVKPLGLAIDLGDLAQTLADSDATAQGIPFQGGLARLAGPKARTWAMRLNVAGTDRVRVRFDGVKLPEGAALYIHNNAGEVRGPFFDERSSFWTPSLDLPAGALYVQLLQTPALAVAAASIDRPNHEDGQALARADARPGFRIGALMLSDSSPQAFCQDNASCVQDGSCYGTSDWAPIDNVRKAIAHYQFVDGGGAFICTGGLVNDNDGASVIPYFLTANHCLSTGTVAATVETYFHYQTSSCGATCPSRGSPYTNGAQLLDTSAADDHTFLQLASEPAGENWYLGWNADLPVSSTEGFQLARISHPRGSPQAFSAHAVWNTSAPSCGDLPRGRFIYSRDLVGATEPGSSGSPVLNSDGQIVGQLFGACGPDPNNACNGGNATVDGAFANYYSRLTQWLKPGGEPGDGPDLVVTSVTSPSSGVAGGTIDVTSVVKNQGSAAADASRLGYFLSTDSTISLSDIDTRWGCDVPALAAGASYSNCTGPIEIPADVAPGTYYLGAYADKNQQVAESNENNNGRAAANTISISSSGGGGNSSNQVYVMFAGYFGRPPAPNGLEYYVGVMDASGGNYLILVDDFYQSPESQLIYGSLTVNQQVDQVYNFLFARDATVEGRAYWSGLVASGAISVAEMAYTIAYNADPDDQAVLDAKLAVSASFVSELEKVQQSSSCEMNNDFGRDLLSRVTNQAQADFAISQMPGVISLMCSGGSL